MRTGQGGGRWVGWAGQGSSAPGSPSPASGYADHSSQRLKYYYYMFCQARLPYLETNPSRSKNQLKEGQAQVITQEARRRRQAFEEGPLPKQIYFIASQASVPLIRMQIPIPFPPNYPQVYLWDTNIFDKCQHVLIALNQLYNQMNPNHNSTKSNPKQSQNRNITPNFLRFKRKSKSGKQEEEGLDSHPNCSERSGSKPGSKISFQVTEKRMLYINPLKKNLGLKVKEGSVQPARRRREGLEVTSRKNSNPKREENEEEVKGNLVATKKNGGTSSNKHIKIGITATSKEKKTSAPKRPELSHEKEERWGQKLIEELPTKLPNYPQIIGSRKRPANKQKEKEKKKKFLNVDLEMKKQQQLDKNYEIYAQLGKGAFGVVKMGLNKKTNEKVAIKIYQKRRLDEPNKIKNLERQINIVSKLKHPVIARLLEVIETSEHIYLIQEYGGANSLYNYLLSKKEHRLVEQEAKQFFKTIAQTIKYLHERNIVHRDIKAENILLNRNKQLKLIDFGFSLESVPPSTIDTFCGTPTYMAPEIVSKRDHVPIYTDLWSLGVFLFVILQGNYPFRAKNQNDLFQKIRKGSFEYIHKDLSEKSRHVIERLVRVNPMERMTCEEMNETFWEWFTSESTGGGKHETTYVTSHTTVSM